jgi:NADH:ubiquinone oxidoreductase subunit F (NADH-binding)
MTTTESTLLGTQETGEPPRLGSRLIELLAQAGLTGRGGAGFPTWRKLAAVATGDRPVVVGNGAEGEPASGKDALLLSRSPDLVLDGLRLVAEAVGAQQRYLYVQPSLVGHVRNAVAGRRDPVRVVAAPDTFLAGEESAVVAALSGRRALPTDKLVRVTQAGLRGRPTLVQNVETLAHIANIARYGPRWFRRNGTPDEPGTFLATISGAVGQPGVHETSYGTPLADVLDLAGGPAAALGAVLVGGYHGVWLSMAQASRVPMSRAGLAPYGGSPGAGVVYALPMTRCGLVETARITGYLAGQAAGQCGPCRNGLPAMADTLHQLAAKGDPRLPARLEHLTRLVTGRGACHHPDGTARLVRSALDVFAGEIGLHLAGRCTAMEVTSRATAHRPDGM